MNFCRWIATGVLLIIIATTLVQARARYCYTCRSRGDRGDCKDPFAYNSTTAEKNKAVKITPCASQWCAKFIEGKEGDDDLATERMCLQRPPEDQMERCAETLYQRRKVFMCMCKGDLCNLSSTNQMSLSVLAIGIFIAFRGIL
ncbi:protein quiver-like [Varroa jacobsoni]|uniref:Protein sleepless n=1 Tax=Varroa destructor TaxID=109461 RepID=A0A7M7M4C5_VARDE|nr:protein quiver-like [Varroa destructor]XP_022647911.1 protein quiver-like [Varroa destructor]XP_022647912.1 protein quiver-like [Varroa destructor]XP_022647913.1 protein quiver-like [Varroa destructor]XP_022698821.1 protein quiver-like [Varroa jacobsoni]XP_022698822.1 protein quiver-like [Varroa jacobsoni]XP_022698823.1 protein quiver-like [Varroa jacobsoni]